MLLKDVWHLFETEVFPVPSTETAFNPYRDVHPELDRPEAAAVRRDNLRRYLAAYEARPPVLVLAEAPGPWGCRFSGVPITSEAQLVDPAFPLDGHASGAAEAPHAEYSAGIYWRVMRPYFPQFFTWNTVPFHPHRPGEPLTIRTPRAAEVRAQEPVLEALHRLLRPDYVVAVGRKAEGALDRLGIACTYVRHPSQGGARRFEAGIHTLFDAAGLAKTG